MPTSAEAGRPDLLVDTSAAIALLTVDHVHHDETFRAIGDRRLGLAGHATFEAYSVLTRLPPPARRSPAVVADLLARNFPASRFLPVDATADLLARLPGLGIAGGAVYDALVGAAAAHHGLALATRDHRARDTYRLLEVEVHLIG